MILVFFQWLFLNQISFKTKQKSKYKVDFNFISFQLKKIFLKYPNFLEKIRIAIKTLLHLHTSYNVIRKNLDQLLDEEAGYDDDYIGYLAAQVSVHHVLNMIC